MSLKNPLKRKKLGSASSRIRKRLRKEVASVNDLPWKSVSRPSAVGFEGDDGILELEEVDDVEVIYEETENGRVARFRVREEESETLPSEQSSSESDNTNLDGENNESEFDAGALLPDWSSYELHTRLLRSLYSLDFTKPTPIQESAIPAALKGKDIVGVAETGSGKTLAYGLPILHGILSRGSTKSIQALILAPTRELALQVVSHLNACISPPSNSENVSTEKRRKPLTIAAVVGGMAVQKQRRIIERGVDVIVATPGRLWELIQEDDDLAKQIGNIRYLVLDEADRMIETGHFAELDNIVRLTSRQSKHAESDPDFDKIETEAADTPEAAREKPVDDPPMQTFVFSATLSKDLQQNLQRRRRAMSQNKSKRKDANKSSTLDELLEKLDFRDPEPTIIDLSPEGGVVSTLKESQVECLSADKDVYLYSFLLRYPGRTLVFLSSIDGIRRLLPLLSLLQLPAYPLHSQLQQRQRLKNLDRFKSNKRAVLLATDVAARGLDIPSVDHVIHYQIPRTTDTYIHRNGRTARASREGFSLLMCAPEERKMVRALLASLGRVGENEIPHMPFEHDLLSKLKQRIQLAKKIDSAQHRSNKEKHEKNWLREAAEAMEIELDSDLDEGVVGGDDGDGDGAGDFSRKKKKKHTQSTNNASTQTKQQAQSLKDELKELLAQPLVAHGVIRKYITSGARSVVSELLDAEGDGPTGMLGYKRGDAMAHLLEGQNQNKPRKKSKTVRNKNEEEWTGFDD